MKVIFIDMADLVNVKATIMRERPKIIWIETISNPLLRIANIPAIAASTHNAGAILMVDSTFTPPYLCRPLEHGADLVIHSATKYLDGHGDAMGRLVIGSRTRCDEVRTAVKLAGGTPGLCDAWLILRGLKTLTLRMRQQCENALALAQWLSTNLRVSKVISPGLPSHPHRTLLACQQGSLALGWTNSLINETLLIVIIVLPACQRELRQFPEAVRGDLVDALARLDAEQSLALPLSRPMPSIRSGVHELRLRDRSGAYRVVYVLAGGGVVYVLHAFQKKTQVTAKKNLDLARKRLKEIKL